ncbi:MAG: nuclear transport factor 2 family protein [Stenotrophomonas sp.]|uniref:nuclear transport factor 2 family protein n=1 Tax=Stenotrophomonas sp. TaxID=69392 RepID=UPI003D6D3082
MRSLTIVLLSLLLAPALAWAQTPATLEQADAAWNQLRLQGDAQSLAPLLAEDWLLTHSDGRIQHKTDYLQELATRQRRNSRIDNEDVQMRRYGDTAIITGTSVQAAVSDGKPWQGRFRFTRVWVQRDGHWQMVASHSSRLAEAAP